MAARVRRSITAVVVAAAFGAVAGCSDDGGSASSDPVPPGAVALTTEVGVCLAFPDSGIVVEIDERSCVGPHDAEVYATFDLTGGPFPGQQAIDNGADAGCLARWADAIGTDFDEDPDRTYTALTPTEETWAAPGGRQVACLVYRLDLAPMVGSVLRAG